MNNLNHLKPTLITVESWQNFIHVRVWVFKHFVGHSGRPFQLSLFFSP